MHDLRRIRGVFERYPSSQMDFVWAILGMFSVVAPIIDFDFPREDARWVPLAIGVGWLAISGLLLWIARPLPGRVIAGPTGTSGGRPLSWKLPLAGVVFLLLLCAPLVLLIWLVPSQRLFLPMLIIIGGMWVGTVYLNHRSLPAALLYAVAIVLPIVAAFLSSEQMLSHEQAWRLGLGVVLIGSGGFGPIALREGLRPPSPRRAARLLADERAPQGLGNPDALPVLAALCGCAGASPLLLQRLSRGPVDEALAELADAGLAVVEPGVPDPRNSIARSTAAGRAAIGRMVNEH